MTPEQMIKAMDDIRKKSIAEPLQSNEEITEMFGLMILAEESQLDRIERLEKAMDGVINILVKMIIPPTTPAPAPDEEV